MDDNPGDRSSGLQPGLISNIENSLVIDSIEGNKIPGMESYAFYCFIG